MPGIERGCRVRVVMSSVAAGLLLTGCAMQPRGYPVPPGLPAETIPLPPVSEEALLWQPGDWAYFGGSYRYETGHYVPRAERNTSWTFGHWTGLSPDVLSVPGGWN